MKMDNGTLCEFLNHETVAETKAMLAATGFEWWELIEAALDHGICIIPPPGEETRDV